MSLPEFKTLTEPEDSHETLCRRTKNARRSSVGLLILAIALTIKAPAQDTPTFTITTREVILDVVVTDKAGHVVDDLTKDDFTVSENGVPRAIHWFETPALHILPSNVQINSTEDLEHNAPEAPCDIIVLDELNTRFEDTAFARYAIRKYLRARNGKLINPTELLAVSEKKIQVLHEFTRDSNAILSSLNAHLTAYPWNLNQGASGQNLIDRLALSLAALEQVAESTKGHAGHKNLIWIGRGFPAIDTDTLQDEAKQSVLGTIHHMLDMLKDSRVTLYTIDPTSLATRYQNISNPDELALAQNENGVDPFAADVDFTTLAPATGGRAYFSRNDVERELDLSSQAGTNFYSISYLPTTQTDAETKYRQILVKVKQSNLTATTRNGYYTAYSGNSASSKRNEIIFDLSTALDSNLKYTDLDVRVDRSRQAATDFVLYIGSGHLSWSTNTNGSRRAQVVIEAGCFGKKGQLLGRTVHGMTLHTEERGTNQVPSPIAVSVAVPQPAGTSRIRFVLRDYSSGRLGTAEISIP